MEKEWGWGQRTVLEVQPSAHRPGAQRFCVFISDVRATPPIFCRSTSAPFRLSQPFGVPGAPPRRALGPRRERREGQAAAAREPGGLVGFDRLGWKTFSFLITSPSPSPRVAKCAWLARLPRAGQPVLSCATGPSWMPGLGYPDEGERTEGGGELASGTGILQRAGCQRGWHPLPSPLLPIQVGSKAGAGV